MVQLAVTVALTPSDDPTVAAASRGRQAESGRGQQRRRWTRPGEVGGEHFWSFSLTPGVRAYAELPIPIRETVNETCQSAMRLMT